MNLLQITSTCYFYLNFALGPLLHVEDKNICISKYEKKEVSGVGGRCDGEVRVGGTGRRAQGVGLWDLGRGNKHIADRVKQQLGLRVNE